MDSFDSWISVKSYIVPKFEIELLQDQYGRYCIRYVTRGEEKYSEWLTDYVTASMYFDMKLMELEGH